MQAATLQHGLFQPRAETSSFGTNAGGASFKDHFDSLLSNRSNASEVQAASPLPQDDRAVRRRESIDNVDRDLTQAVSETESSRSVERAREAQKDENELSDPSAESIDSSKTEDSAQRSADEKDDDTAQDEAEAAALLLAAGAVVTMDQQKGDVDVTPVVVDAPEDTPAETDPTQIMLKTTAAAEVLAKEAATPANTSGTAANGKPSAPSKLDELLSQMEAVAESPETAVQPADADASASGEGEQQSADLLGQDVLPLEDGESPAEAKTGPSTFDRELNTLQNNLHPAAKNEASQAVKMQMPQSLTPEAKFAQDNVDQVVTSVRTQSISGGGSMNVRLDPPELGALQVAVRMIEGRLTASFTTNNEQATQLLSHSLNHLKSSLEASGVHVDRIEVRQAPQSESSNSKSNGDGSQQQSQRGFDSQSHQSEQQRKEMVQRMWRKLAYGGDDLDLVA